METFDGCTTTTITQEDLARAAREEGYSRALARFRGGDMPESEWQKLLADPDFQHWLLVL